MLRSLLLLMLCLLTFAASAQSSPEVMSFTRMYSDAKGLTHFADAEILFGETNVNGAKITPFTSATAIGYLLLPAGFSQGWSPTPVAQWIIIISGQGELEVLDGEVRKFSAGSILKIEDTTGAGHKTRNIGDEPLIIAWIATGGR